MPALREPSQRVSPRARLMWAHRGRARGRRAGRGRWSWSGRSPTGCRSRGGSSSWSALAGVAYVVVMPQWRYRVHRWEVTDTAVYTQTGWWVRERRIAPMSRIQTVDHAEGALARLFGLATVTVTTASAAGALEIVGPRARPGARAGRRAGRPGRHRRGRRHVTTPQTVDRRARPTGSGSTRGCCWSTRSASWSASCRSLVGIFVAGTASGRHRLVARARRRDPDRARRAALLHDVLPDHRRAGSSCAAGCSTGTCSRPRSTGSAPSTSPPPSIHRVLGPDHGPDRHRHGLEGRRGPPRPRRAARRPGPRSCAPSCCALGAAAADPRRAAPTAADRVVLRFDPAWVRFAPLTTSRAGASPAARSASRRRRSTPSAASTASTPTRSSTAPPAGRSALAVPIGLVAAAGRSSRRSRSAGTSSPTGASR